MSEKEYQALSVIVARGVCPYCGRSGMTNRFGNFARHRRTCGRQFTRLGKKMIFALRMSETTIG